MSVLLALLMFVLVMMLGHLVKRGAPPTAMAPAATVRRFRPLIESKFGMDVPRGHCSHPCHTWAVDEGWQLIRVGLDRFAVNLLGKIEHIDSRWTVSLGPTGAEADDNYRRRYFGGLAFARRGCPDCGEPSSTGKSGTGYN